MKTKIIYISGNEVFDMADIRAAFEEVRTTLGLGRDTIMFGVPVDNDDAFVAQQPASAVAETEAVITNDTSDEPVIIDDVEPAVVSDTAEITAPVVEEVIQADTEIIAEDAAVVTPEKKSTTRKPRTRKVATTSQSTETADAPATNENEKIIPILSVLASQKNTDAPVSDNSDNNDNDVVDVDATDDDIVDTVADIDIGVDAPVDAPVDTDTAAQHAAIADMITDDAPDAPIEKTLEQLLESMTPLREDIVEEVADTTDAVSDNVDDLTDAIADASDTTDATLEQLAAEFAENQDKIPTPQKNAAHSKIGKLKNILPFKKAKREDSGLMGDLFGWAGIAANDDDFTIPGFFTNAASKK